MNMFTSALLNVDQFRPKGNPIMTRTTNGMRARVSTSNANVDLFGSIGAMRGKDVIPAFAAAYAENKDYALRIAQWVRDVRGGTGERQIYRDILKWLEKNDREVLLESNLLENATNLGRFDDLLIFDDAEIKQKAYGIIAKALDAGNGLAAKWMPRKGPIAVELRRAFDLTPKQYRKILVGLTNVVETQMCAKNWNEINFSHVPSVAMSKYLTAFHRNAPEEMAAYKAALVRNDGTAKVNAGAVYPYDVVKMVMPSYYGAAADNVVADEMWKALPNYMNGASVLPMVDVSGSMSCPAGKDTSLTCLQVALSLGLYCSDKTTSAFKDVFMTFSANPEFVTVRGTLAQKLDQMNRSNWDMNTNLNRAFEKLLAHSVSNRVPAEDMPKILLILSDMQFDQCARFDDSAQQMIRRKYEDAGYEMPATVFWNLNDRGNKPVKFNDSGVALVSGFSPAIMKSILAADLDKFSPESIMLGTIGSDRYNW